MAAEQRAGAGDRWPQSNRAEFDALMEDMMRDVIADELAGDDGPPLDPGLAGFRWAASGDALIGECRRAAEGGGA
jgi:hypothetical protein